MEVRGKEPGKPTDRDQSDRGVDHRHHESTGHDTGTTGTPGTNQTSTARE